MPTNPPFAAITAHTLALIDLAQFLSISSGTAIQASSTALINPFPFRIWAVILDPALHPRPYVLNWVEIWALRWNLTTTPSLKYSLIQAIEDSGYVAMRVILLDKRPGDLLMELEELGKNELLILG